MSAPVAGVVGLYLRVSTDTQHVENQRAAVEQLVRARGFEPRFFEEQESAVKHRPVFDSLMAAARRGEIRAVAVVALDRLHRSMQSTIATVLELDRLGVQVLSVREPWLDTAGPVRPLLIAIFGWVAEQERLVLIERTKMGIERARRAGKRVGRPEAAPVLVRAAADLVGAGVAVSVAAREKGVSRAALRRHLAKVAEKGVATEPRNTPTNTT